MKCGGLTPPHATCCNTPTEANKPLKPEMNKQTAIALTCWSVLDAASSVQWVALNPWGDIVAGYTTREGRFETSVIRLQGMPKARRHRRAAVRALGRIHAKKMA